jgi:hypothetical protein
MRLFNRKKEKKSIKDQLIVFFNEIKYNYNIVDESEERTVFHLGVGLNIGNSDAYVLIYPAIKIVEIAVVSPINIPVNKRMEVAKFLDLADYTTYCGNLQMNHKEGTIRCKTYFNYGYENVELETISFNFFGAFNMIERYIPGVLRITYGGKDADSAFAEINGEINPTNN